jgi:hypothetical protein
LVAATHQRSRPFRSIASICSRTVRPMALGWPTTRRRAGAATPRRCRTDRSTSRASSRFTTGLQVARSLRFGPPRRPPRSRLLPGAGGRGCTAGLSRRRVQELGRPGHSEGGGEGDHRSAAERSGSVAMHTDSEAFASRHIRARIPRGSGSLGQRDKGHLS